MAPKLSGQTSIFGAIAFVSKSLLGIQRQKKHKKWQFWPESLGAMLEYWYIKRGRFNPPHEKRWRMLRLSIVLRERKPKNVHKNVQKSYKIFKPKLHNVLSTRTNILKIWPSLCLLGSVRSAKYCGKMYSHHLFSYGGFRLWTELIIGCIFNCM